MTIEEIRAWLLGRRRHWCVECSAPVKRVTRIERVLLGHRVFVECHGARRDQPFSDSFVEDHTTTHVVRWFDDALILARLDRHGRITQHQGAIE